MTTASDVRMKIQNSMVCEGMDDWIDDYLVPAFMKSGGAKVTVTVLSITCKGWNERAFLTEMKDREFNVRALYPDRPCADGVLRDRFIFLKVLNKLHKVVYILADSVYNITIDKQKEM